jgi:hypothetical protein
MLAGHISQEGTSCSVSLGKTHTVEFKPAGGNILKATGDFAAAKGMKVIVEDRQGRWTELSGAARSA